MLPVALENDKASENLTVDEVTVYSFEILLVD